MSEAGKNTRFFSSKLSSYPTSSVSEILNSTNPGYDEGDFSYGGRGGYRFSKRMLYGSCASVIFVVESPENPVIADEAREELHVLMSDSGLQKAALLILAVSNKDLPDMSDKLELQKLKDRAWKLQVIPALDKADLTKSSMTWLTEMVEDQIAKANPSKASKTTKSKGTTGDKSVTVEKTADQKAVEEKNPAKKSGLFSSLRNLIKH